MRNGTIFRGELQQLVPGVIAMVLHSGQREGLQYGQRGEIYGFVHPGGGICWGVDNPGNIARGVISGLELNEEMLRFPAVLRPYRQPAQTAFGSTAMTSGMTKASGSRRKRRGPSASSITHCRNCRMICASKSKTAS